MPVFSRNQNAKFVFPWSASSFAHNLSMRTFILLKISTVLSSLYPQINLEGFKEELFNYSEYGIMRPRGLR